MSLRSGFSFGGTVLVVAAGVAGLVLLFSPLGTGRTGILGSDVRARSADVIEAARRVREHPDDPRLRLIAARLFIERGRASGDARLVAAAETVLDPVLQEQPGITALTLAATARQHLHDFSGALVLLDRAIARQPTAGALLTRANIHVVQGRFDSVRADCPRLAALGRFDLAILCAATADALTADAPAAYRRLQGLMASGAMDPALEGYAYSLLGEIAAFQEWPERARQNFEAAREAAPDNLRSMTVYADFLLSQDQARLALEQMAAAPPTDAILVRRAIAYKRLGKETELAPIRDELMRRFRRNWQAGSIAHAREEARYLLEVAEEPLAALKRARLNWSKQREFEDARLLLDAARAAGAPESAEPVLAWMREQGVTAPALAEHAARLPGTAVAAPWNNE